jgi:hypothetical protein
VIAIEAAMGAARIGRRTSSSMVGIDARHPEVAEHDRILSARHAIDELVRPKGMAAEMTGRIQAVHGQRLELALSPARRPRIPLVSGNEPIAREVPISDLAGPRNDAKRATKS